MSDSSQTYQRAELNWYASKYPLATFKNGTIVRFQDDGNLCVYDSSDKLVATVNSLKAKGEAIGDYSLMFQNDGNFVAYSKEKGPYWHSNTANDAKTCVIQAEKPYIRLMDASNNEIWNIVDAEH